MYMYCFPLQTLEGTGEMLKITAQMSIDVLDGICMCVHACVCILIHSKDH